MKTFKKLLSALLVAVMLISAAPLSGFDFSVSAEETTYKTADIVEFGSYPQSKVTDEATVAQLDAVTKNWISYGYYSGSGERDDGNMAPSDYMKYCDITLDGSKYRAVTFSKYRTYYTGHTANTSADYTYQDVNGYYINNVYYFKYEPLKWRVLDASTGLVVCDSAIDSQAYNNYVLYTDGYYGDSAQTYYASDWEHSSLRAWLNNDFLNTAFTSGQQSRIREMTRENKSTISSKFDSNPTSDKITLLSYWDVLNTSYGFNSSYNAYDTARQRRSTDYAKCQGGDVSSRYKTSKWWLRSPDYSDSAAEVGSDGRAATDYIYVGVNNAYIGVVPVLNFYNLSNLQSSHTVTYNYSYNGGTSATVTSATVNEGSTISLTPTATKSGWTFVGWNTDSSATTGLSSLTMGSSDVTLYAIYKKTLTATFVDYSGSAKKTRTATATIYNKATSGTVTAPTQNTYSGWTAKGWTKSTAANASAVSSFSISSDTTFYGLYQRTLTLSYNANGGSSTPTKQTGTQYTNSYAISSYKNPSFTLASAISRTGYKFSGWALGSTSGTKYNAGSSITISSDTTMYAAWNVEENIYNLGEETYSFDNFVDSDSRGHCFGMSATSAGYYLGCLDQSIIGDSTASLYSFERTEKVKKPICYYQEIQGKYSLNATVAGGSYYKTFTSNINKDWEEIIAYVKNHDYDNSGALQIGFRKNSEGGHAINFLYYAEVDGQPRIYAYDNNFPDTETYFYKASNGKVYQAPYSTFSGSIVC